MKILKLITYLTFISSVTSSFSQISFGKAEKINEQWQFYLGDHPNDKTEWKTLDLPHDWSVKEPLSPSLASCQGFLPGGIGWYRKMLSIPKERQGEKIYLYFEGVYNRSEVFLNGQSLGSRPNGYISFTCDITPFVQYGKENEISVRVNHSQDADSRWYTGSGIYRNVWIIYANPVHIAQWGVFVYPKNTSKKNAVLMTETEIVNELPADCTVTIMNELILPSGKIITKKEEKLKIIAGKKSKCVSDLIVPNPQLWDLEHPNLYTLRTTVLQNGKKIDETITTTGFRSFTFDPDNGFSLNGKNIKIKGVCIHHDAGVLGSAVPPEVWERRLQTLKEIGVNAIRTSHNPQAPDLYDLCDKLGMLVLNEAYDEWEFPKNKWIDGWNVGTPGHQGSFDIFEKWGEQDLADMVSRDRNHVSVFAWSIGNEVDYPNDPYSHPILDGDNKDFTQKINGGYKKDAPDANRLGGIAKRLVAVVKQQDPSRPVTAGLAGVAMSNETEYPFALDICGYNYTESRYISDHEKYPERVIFGSENRHDLEAWNAVKNNKPIFGQFLWTGIDYLGESGEWPSRGFYSGLMDFAGFIKPRGYFRKALWSEKPTIYIGTYPSPEDLHQEPSMDAWPIWNYEEEQQIRVVCYTNAKRAQLFLNDRPIEGIKERDDSVGIIFWDIPYKAGKLLAKGYDSSNNEIGQYAIQTSGQAVEMVLNAYQNMVNKDRGLAQIEILLLDKDGIPAIFADNNLSCRIEGPGRLLGLEAGNNTDMGNYCDNEQRAYHGRMLAYVEATGVGDIKVVFSSPYLKTERIVIYSK